MMEKCELEIFGFVTKAYSKSPSRVRQFLAKNQNMTVTQYSKSERKYSSTEMVKIIL
jgi:hypothetical protein